MCVTQRLAKHPGTPAGMSPADRLRRMVAALASGDTHDVASFIDPEYVVPPELDDQPATMGAAGFQHLASSVRSRYSDLSIAVQNVIEEGDQAQAKFIWEGTVASSGEMWRQVTIERLQMRDGRVWRHWCYVVSDTARDIGRAPRRSSRPHDVI